MSVLDQSQLERVLTVGRSVVAARDPEEVLRLVLEAARDLTDARYAALGVLDEDGHELERFLYVGIDEPTRQAIGPLPRGRGILGELIRDPRPLRLKRIGDHPRSYGFPHNHPPMETFLGTPVRIRDSVYGNLYLTEKEGGGEFTEADERLLVVLADWAAIAIDNSRALADASSRRAELERAMRGLEATASLNSEVGGETELDRVMELVVKRSRALVDARISVCFCAEAGSLTVGAAAGEIDRAIIGAEAAPDSPPADALRARATVEVDELAARRLGPLGINATKGLLVPLRSRGQDVGVLALFDRIGPEGPGMTRDDRLALESFAASAASSIAATRAIEDEKLRLSIKSSELERRRWARELHDETLQELGALKVMQESALQVGDEQAARRLIAQASDQVERVIASLQGLITELRPASLDQLGVGAALEALVSRMQTRTGLDVELDVRLAYELGIEPTRLAPDLEGALYRVAQEALTNVVKHAHAGRARVAVSEDGDRVDLTIEDDGVGVEEASSDGRGSGGGFGLVGMQERVELLNGELAVEAPEEGGTRVRATFPVVRTGTPPGQAVA
jgi:signal transduction histidine kinase